MAVVWSVWRMDRGPSALQIHGQSRVAESLDGQDSSASRLGDRWEHKSLMDCRRTAQRDRRVGDSIGRKCMHLDSFSRIARPTPIVPRMTHPALHGSLGSAK